MTAAETLDQSAALLGCPLAPTQVDALLRYRDLLLSWNQAMNLVGEADPDLLLHKHLVDGLVYRAALGSPTSLVDVGSGNGLPGVVLAIALPDTAVTLVESNLKRCTFLNEAGRSLGLGHLTVVAERAEDAGRSAELREAFAVAVARRVAALPVLLEYVLPLVAVGGRAVLAKGAGLDEELAASAGVPEKLGGRWGEALELTAPPASVALGEPATRRFVVVEKGAPTADAYPRRAGRPSKQPLRGA